MEITLTVTLINEAMKGNAFWLDSTSREAWIIARATTLGYVKRLSHTQVQWTDEGLAKARRELEEERPTYAYVWPETTDGKPTGRYGLRFPESGEEGVCQSLSAVASRLEAEWFLLPPQKWPEWLQRQEGNFSVLVWQKRVP